MPDDVARLLKTELYGADGTVARQINLDKKHHSKLQMSARSSLLANPHTYTLDFSYDNVTWYNHYISAAPEQERHLTIPDVAARYWRLLSDAVVGAHTVDLVLASVPG